MTEGHLCCGYFVSVKLAFWCALCRKLGVHSSYSSYPCPASNSSCQHQG